MPLRLLTARSHGAESLLRRSRADPDAFAKFYEQNARTMLMWMTRRVLDAEIAVDLTAETFAIAMEKSPAFRGRSAEEERAWLWAIGRSQLARFARDGDVERRAVRRLGIQRAAIDDDEIERIQADAGVHALRERVQSSMKRLPAEQREAVNLRIVDELGYMEVATIAGVSEQVARARVSRGLRLIRRWWVEDGIVIDGEGVR